MCVISDDELLEVVARKMWERSHDGSWDDVEHCVSEFTRQIYLADAKVALEVIFEGEKKCK